MSLKFRQRRLIWCTVSTSSASSTISFYICGGLHCLEGHEMQYLTHIDCATLTFMTQGNFRYVDTTGQQGVLAAGGVEWMKAGNGVWHSGTPVGDTQVKGFQLWMALPAAEENTPAQSIYLAPSDVPQEGPARALWRGEKPYQRTGADDIPLRLHAS